MSELEQQILSQAPLGNRAQASVPQAYTQFPPGTGYSRVVTVPHTSMYNITVRCTTEPHCILVLCLSARGVHVHWSFWSVQTRPSYKATQLQGNPVLGSRQGGGRQYVQQFVGWEGGGGLLKLGVHT